MSLSEEADVAGAQGSRGQSEIKDVTRGRFRQGSVVRTLLSAEEGVT